MALIMLQIATMYVRGGILRTPFEIPSMPGASFLLSDLRTSATSLGKVGTKSLFAGLKARALLEMSSRKLENSSGVRNGEHCSRRDSAKILALSWSAEKERSSLKRGGECGSLLRRDFITFQQRLGLDSASAMYFSVSCL